MSTGLVAGYSQLEAARLLLRRRLTLVLIVLLFLLAAVILTASVVHDVRNRRLLEAEWAADWEEVECEAGDADCEAALCPRGMVWSRDTGQCRVRDGELSSLELQTKVLEDYAKISQSRRRPLLVHYARRCLLRDCEIFGNHRLTFV